MLKVPAAAWTPAVEAGGEIRDGAWIAELTGDVLDGWPKGMRLIVRKGTASPRNPIAAHERGRHAADLFHHQRCGPADPRNSRHRLRARAEDRIRAGRTPTGGWSRERLADWGVAWPPPKGWKERLIARSKAQ